MVGRAAIPPRAATHARRGVRREQSALVRLPHPGCRQIGFLRQKTAFAAYEVKHSLPNSSSAAGHCRRIDSVDNLWIGSPVLSLRAGEENACHMCRRRTTETSVRATTKFKSMLGGGAVVVAPGAFDGLSARLVEQAGFPAVYASGGAIARSSGVPDIGLITPDEIVQRLGQMVEAVGVPVIADADTGYGNALT